MSRSANASLGFAERDPSLAGARPTAWVRFLVPAALGLVADLVTKSYAFPGLIDPTPNAENGLHPFPPPTPLIPHVLGFRTICNPGAVFGLGPGHGMLFIIFSVVAVGVILAVFWRSRAEQWVLHTALGLILAGALGNLHDRFRFGVVRDFLLFQVDWYPYIFNVADVLLCIGVPLLMLCWFLQPEGDKDAAGFPVEGERVVPRSQ